MFRGRDAIARGLLTRNQLTSAAWRPLLRGVYADARLPVDHGLRISAAGLVIPSTAVIAGRSAAWWYGAEELVEPDDPVDVLVPERHRFGPVAGLRIRTTRALTDTEVEVDDRVRLTAHGRTAVDVACSAPSLTEAVVALDVMLRQGAVRPRQLDRASRAASGPRARRAVRAAALADGRSESPQETRLRLAMLLAGLPPPVPQFEVRSGGRFVARVDLAYPEHRLAIEYDGRWHAETGQFGRDRRRLNALVSAGWRVVHVTAQDLHDMDALVAGIRAALAR